MERQQNHETQTEAKPFVYMMVKPLGLEPEVHDEIVGLISERGVVVHTERFIVEREKIQTHYDAIKLLNDGSPAPHFTPITEYLIGQEVEGMIVEDWMRGNPDAFVADMRGILGKSNPLDTHPGQIRNLALSHVLPYMRVMPKINTYDNSYCRDNLAHCSDSLEAAITEISIWLPHKAEVYKQNYEKLRQA